MLFSASEAGIGEDDEEDNNPKSSFMVCVDREPDDDHVVLFLSTEVLLDSGAGQCIFSNPDLVHSIATITGRHRSIKGVNKTESSLAVKAEGLFADLPCKISIARDAAANLLSQALLKDAGCAISYEEELDHFVVRTPSREWTFNRKLYSDGSRSRHYVRDMVDELPAPVLVTTVDENIRRVTKREAEKAADAVVLRTRLGYISTNGMMDILQGGVNNCSVTPADVRHSEAVFGKSSAALKGKTRKHRSAIAVPMVTGPRRQTQVQQSLSVDVMFVKRLAFMIGVLSPLGLALVQHIKDRSAASVFSATTGMVNDAKSHHFIVREIKTDEEGALAAHSADLRGMGILVNTAGPGQHVPVVERMIQTVKSTVRSYENSLPYVMPQLMLTFCVLYAVRSANFRPNSMSMDKLSPYEQFTGQKLDVKRDLRCGFGDFAQATVPVTDNSMAPRTQGCICLLPSGNSTGSVKMWCLATDSVVTRDQFVILPMTAELCRYITVLAEKQGYSRGSDPLLEGAVLPTDFANTALAAPPLADMMPIDGRVPVWARPPVHDEATPSSPVDAGLIAADIGSGAVDIGGDIGGGAADIGGGAADIGGEGKTKTGMEIVLPTELRRSARIAQAAAASWQAPVFFSAEDAFRADLCRIILHTSDWHDPTFVFKITVKSAMRDRPVEALPVIKQRTTSDDRERSVARSAHKESHLGAASRRHPVLDVLEGQVSGFRSFRQVQSQIGRRRRPTRQGAVRRSVLAHSRHLVRTGDCGNRGGREPYCGGH